MSDTPRKYAQCTREEWFERWEAWTANDYIAEEEQMAMRDCFAHIEELERENAALRAELEGVRKDVAIFREALIHIGQHMQTDEQSAYMPLNEWIGHASVDDARKRDRELIDAALAQGEGEK